MKTFETPEPVQAALDLAAGDVRIVAERRGDTRVRVNPLDPANDDDATAAGLTEVEYSAGRLKVYTPRLWRHRTGAVEVEVLLPEGSGLEVDLSAGGVHSHGRLGETRIRTTHGEIQLDQTAGLHLKAGSGHVCVAAVEGPAVIKMPSGDLFLGEVTGSLRVRAANGRIVVERAHADIEVTTAHGDIRIDEVIRGLVTLTTGSGTVDVGVSEGSAAVLHLRSTYGTVHDLLEAEPPLPKPTPKPTIEPTPRPTPKLTSEATPEGTPKLTSEATPEGTPKLTSEATPEGTSEATPEPTIEIHASTTHGNVVVRRVAHLRADDRKSSTTTAGAAIGVKDMRPSVRPNPRPVRHPRSRP
ncbi:DUF4097 family beta strand repeat-containing protein [Nonomuraea endophytica]|uniref:DUF4097 domain-containing protein n=1 Tax=Nonomuraea endophytica TaxID=714136 RepID=A0A7W8A0G5_9ACTN|nr:DUF4097 family beta strand repeat-containing protein [Nonomuraea endophytica]MBB5076158.1 hypothetical protein [Nonomuraea endophytica]